VVVVVLVEVVVVVVSLWFTALSRVATSVCIPFNFVMVVVLVVVVVVLEDVCWPSVNAVIVSLSSAPSSTPLFSSCCRLSAPYASCSVRAGCVSPIDPDTTGSKTHPAPNRPPAWFISIISARLAGLTGDCILELRQSEGSEDDSGQSR
jgi:hypothetical protein